MAASTTVPRRWQVPRLNRDERWVGGAAAAIARELGAQTLVVRACFVVLAFVGGWGLLLYTVVWGALAIGSPYRLSEYHPVPKAATGSHRNLALGMITLGLVIFFSNFTSSLFLSIVYPVGFILTGALVAWTRSGEDGTTAVTRVLVGVALAAGGLIAFAALSVSLRDGVIAFIFGITIIFGIGLVAAPSVVRMGQDLDHERQERIRSDERARISAHIHDSVLQTLTLIQQAPEDAARTRQLARRQERELRNWLYGTSTDTPAGLRLGPALEFAASSVEDAYDVGIAVVAVGDTDDLVPADIDALIAASKEAMTNAAKHAGVGRIDVFAERSANRIEVFVRDTGAGFDPKVIDQSRHGLADSIIARMKRAGGTALVHSEVGLGTEVELSLPLSQTSQATNTQAPDANNQDAL